MNKKEVKRLVVILLCTLPLVLSAAKKDNNIKVYISGDGVEEELIQSIENNLFVNNLMCDEAEWRVHNAAKKIDAELGEAINAFGYYNAEYSKKVEQKDNCWQVSLNIDLGPRTKVELVDIKIVGEANEDQEFQKKLGLLPIKAGDDLRHDHYEKIKELIEAAAQVRGYFDGAYQKHSLRINKAKNLANIIIQFDSGPRYRIGEIKYDQDILTDELFDKYFSLKIGEYYHSSNIIKTYQDLGGNGYFADVDVKALIDERSEGAVPVEIKLIKSKRNTYSVGVGASTDSGPRFRLEHQNKRVNSRGHNYDAKLLLSPVVSNLSFNYKIPIGQPQTDFIGLQLGAAHEDTDSSKSDSIVANLGRTKLRSNGWLESIFLEYLQEDFEVGEDDDSSALLMPGISWSKTHSNNPIYPTLGYHLSMEARGATESFLSDVDLVHLKLNSKGILPLGKKLRFLARLEAGYNFVDDFIQLPASLRFFAGGDNSIRGYEYESLGPEGSDGDVVGGEGLLVGSAEVDYAIKPKWAIAAFIDGGNAFEVDDIQIKKSAGLGVRWRSPIGPVKVDLAFPIEDDDEDDFRLHFSLGPEL